MTAGDALDYLIIGSGFGGSVSALRLAEKGWRVHVVEQGRRIGPDEIRAAKAAPLRRFLWQPALGQRGYLVQHLLKHVGILGGVGVGGGSLVWGAVMLPPKPAFYAAPVWAQLGIDMRAELAPHLDTARRMLGVSPNPRIGQQDRYLKMAAEAMGQGETHGPVPQAIHFGPPGQTIDDPYFDGEGPARRGCHFCGECIAGCEFGAKNSLDYNYLHLAQQAGATVQAETRAERIAPAPGGGYAVTVRGPGGRQVLYAQKLVLAAGVIGTLQLLLTARDIHRTLPQVSPRCGEVVRTNSEALTGILSRRRDEDLLRDGTTISSDFYADAVTHITQNRIPPALGAIMRGLFVPMVDSASRWRRALRSLASLLLRPRDTLTTLFARHWAPRMTTLTVMQNDDSGVALRLGRRWWAPWRRQLVSAPPVSGKMAPSHLPLANAATRAYAEASGGIALSSVMEAVGGKAMTAHILGGCAMGAGRDTGVIDADHQVHGHPDLYVVDGAAIPANLGVNPSLTIAAMAERFAARQPDKAA